MKPILRQNAGFTLVEILLVVVLLAVIAAVTLTSLAETNDAARFAETRAKMEAIRIAILGDDIVDELGHRVRFGYHGDMGRLPPALTDLTALGGQPAWTFDTFFGFGVGWRGPYVAEQFTTALAVTLDAWGNTFTYDPAGTPPSLTSEGADNTAGGVLYDADLVVQFPATLRLSSVSGVVADGAMKIGTANVEIRYPVAGVQTAGTFSTTFSGAFTFDSVPWGVRSLRVTGPSPVPELIPTRITVDSHATNVPEHTLNYQGKTGISFTSVDLPGGADLTADITINSSYRQTMTIDHVIVTNSLGATITSFDAPGPAPEAIPNVASGVKLKPRGVYTIAPGSNVIQLIFSTDMSDANYQMTIVWTTVTRRDTIQFTSP